MRRTSSLWGQPPSRFYRLLSRAEASLTGSLRLIVVGCADGKFVLPAARRGHEVVAIDIDGIALFGGTKTGPSGEEYMPGLAARLSMEGLESHVEVIHGDFMNLGEIDGDLVFTSGALQYSRNMVHPMTAMVSKLKEMVRLGGYFYADYMLPPPDRVGRDNYPGRETWSAFFQGREWAVISNRVLPPQFEAAHVDLPVDHEHHWGHILCRRAAHE